MTVVVEVGQAEQLEKSTVADTVDIAGAGEFDLLGPVLVRVLAVGPEIADQ